MAWLDDRIRDHPKILELSRAAFQHWVFTLCYCSEHGTGGRADGAIKALRTPSNVVDKLVAVGLWEREQDGSIWVHDWQEYNGKRDAAKEEQRAQARERQRRHRAKMRRNVTRDSDVTVTRDSERDMGRDSERDSSRARAGPRPNDHDHVEEPSPSFPRDLDHPEPLPGDEPPLEGRKETSNNGDLETLGEWATHRTAATSDPDF